MAAKTFEQALNESKEDNPSWGTYIHLCTVFCESGASRNEVKKAFKYYMPEDEYDKHETDEMVDYLFKIAHQIPE